MRKILIISTNRFDYEGITSVIFNYYRRLDLNKFKIDFVTPLIIRNELINEVEQNGGKIYQIERTYKKLRSYYNK